MRRKKKEARRRAEDIARAGGGRLLTNEHLDKLTGKEIALYLETGILPPLWKLRRRRER